MARGRAALPEDDYRPETTDKRLNVGEYRLLHPDYLHEEEYAQTLGDCFGWLRKHMSEGYARFHLPYMLELLESERRYKEAYKLLKEISRSFENIGDKKRNRIKFSQNKGLYSCLLRAV